jgi:DNA polymerase/3'-5' exonuclease PolX
LAFSAVQQVPAAAVERSDVPTITILTTTTLNQAITTTILTQFNCGVIDSSITGTCRRKRQFWIDVPILIAQDPETAAYLYQQFQPSPVYA